MECRQFDAATAAAALVGDDAPLAVCKWLVRLVSGVGFVAS